MIIMLILCLVCTFLFGVNTEYGKLYDIPENDPNVLRLVNEAVEKYTDQRTGQKPDKVFFRIQDAKQGFNFGATYQIKIKMETTSKSGLRAAKQCIINALDKSEFHPLINITCEDEKNRRPIVTLNPLVQEMAALGFQKYFQQTSIKQDVFFKRLNATIRRIGKDDFYNIYIQISSRDKVMKEKYIEDCLVQGRKHAKHKPTVIIECFGNNTDNELCENAID